MHHIQKQILQKLIYKPSLGFAELRPEGIESNHFMYHLRQLINEGYIEKTTKGYCLSKSGKSYADRLSLKDYKPRIQPKIVTLIVLKKPSGEHLLYKRAHQPFFGKIGFPYGKIHLGESIAEAANRELEEKTGLIATLRLIGDAYVTVYEDGELLSQMLAHVFVGKYRTGEIQNRSNKGKSFWADINKSKSKQYIPGFLDIYHEANNKKSKSFFKEFVYKL